MKTRVWQLVACISLAAASWQTYRLSNTTPAKGTDSPSVAPSRTEGDAPRRDDFSMVSEQYLVDDALHAQTTQSICSALERLAYVQSREAVDATITRANDSRAAVRACAASSLSHHGNASAREMLVALVRDRSVTVALSAMNALSQVDGDDVDSVLRENAHNANVTLASVAFSALARLHRPNLVPLMTELLSRLSMTDQSSIVDSLANTRDPAVVDTLIQLSDMGMPEQRASMLRALGRTGDPRAYALLRSRASTASTYELIAIVQALAEDESPESRAILFNAVDTGDEEVANAAIVALTSANDPAIASVALRWLSAERIDLLTALGTYFLQHPDPAAAPLLAKFVERSEFPLDDVGDVFGALIECDVNVAITLAQKLATEHRDMALMPLLREMENNAATQSAAFDTLRLLLKSGRELENTWEVLQMLARDPTPEGRQLLIAFALDRTSPMHASAVDALVQSGAPELRSTVETIARDMEDPAVENAWNWLALWGGHEGVQVLLSLQQSLPPERRQQILNLLSMTGDPDVSAYVAIAARDEAPLVRAWASRELTKRWGAESTALLETLGSDSDPDVAVGALRSLVVRSPARAESLLMPLLEQGSPDAAIEVAQRLPAQRGISLISTVFRSTNYDAVMSAVSAMSRYHDPQARDWIAWLMRDTSRALPLRQAAAQALLANHSADDLYGREARELMEVHAPETPAVEPTPTE